MTVTASHTTPGLVADLLAQHLEEHSELPDGARRRDLGAEKALVRDYAGRVVFELLQNALDRAMRSILVRWDERNGGGGRLLVGNDGRPVSVWARPATAEEPASDFHSLLTLHDSSKSARESVGNKGVGFRSVFSASPEVEVWSRLSESGWWGLGLRHPTQHPQPSPEWSSAEVPSFYAPRSLRADDDAGLAEELGLLPEHLGTMQTVVHLRRVDDGRDIAETIALLQRLPLAFLRERARFPDDLSIHLEQGEKASICTLSRERWTQRAGSSMAMTEEMRGRTGLDLECAHVEVALAAEGQTDDARYWSYLPTEQLAGHGVHVHADFYLNNSRRSVVYRPVGGDATQDADPPVFNYRLLQRAADAIDALFEDPEVVTRGDLWRLLAPSSCECKTLRGAVAERLLASKERFQRLVSGGFAADPGEANWTLRRYREFFEALEQWAHHAYRIGLRRPGVGTRLKDWRAALRSWVQESGAPVIPIVAHADEDDVPVPQARPVPPPGSARDRESIYLRSTPGMSLPPVLARQDTFATSFRPPGMNREAEFGLLPYERAELLANIRPGASLEEHEELLRTALRIAIERPERGGKGSVLERSASELGGGPGWRFREQREGAPRKSALTRAGEAIVALFVPTLGGGWTPAARCTNPGPMVRAELAGGAAWPWPVVDLARLESLIPSCGVEDAPLDLKPCCRLLGISAGPPLIEDGGEVRLSGWPRRETDPPATSLMALGVLEAWERDLGAFIAGGEGAHPRAEAVRRQLQRSRWLHPGPHEELLGGRLEHPVHWDPPFAPRSVWLQPARGGFRTELLPRVVGDHEMRWTRQLGVTDVLTGAEVDRIQAAMEWLREQEVDHDNGPDLARTYTALVRAYTRLVGRSPIDEEDVDWLPVLVREHGRGGEHLRWADEGEEVWFDSGGRYSGALAAFDEFSEWVVRAESVGLAKRRGLVEFAPEETRVAFGPPGDPELAETLRAELRAALPMMLAGAQHTRGAGDLDGPAVLLRWATLEIRHYEDVWVEYGFRDKHGALGHEEAGDVLWVREDVPHLAFDGRELPLARCAMPLADALCHHRGFARLFESVLHAHAAGPSALRHVQRELRVSQEDLDGWRERVESSELSDEQRAMWRHRVNEALEPFGRIRQGTIRPGERVRPNWWAAVEVSEATEEQVADALAVGLGRSLERLNPTVDFASTHERVFKDRQRSLRCRLVAEAVCPLPVTQWTEARREELVAEIEAPATDDEHRAFCTLGCDAEALLRARLDITGSPEGSENWARAQAFGKGQIPVAALPRDHDEGGELARWASGGASADTVMEPLTDTEYVRRARRKASGGQRAQTAILSRAMDEALAWLDADPRGFWAALDSSLGFCEGRDSVANKLDAAKDSPNRNLVKLLRVWAWWGNAGFDVLAPQRHANRFVLAEVKRVSDLGRPEFFLSENERRQALEHRRAARPWRLWLVAGDGNVRDATWVADRFVAADEAVGRLLAEGLRPGEWFFRVTR